MPVHLEIDNKNVYTNVGRIIDGWSGPPCCLCTDGDLRACIAGPLRYRSSASVKVSKVKGHATVAMVADGRVRREDKEGNDAADIAADFGRLRQPGGVIDARRNLLRVRKRVVSYRMLVLHQVHGCHIERNPATKMMVMVPKLTRWFGMMVLEPKSGRTGSRIIDDLASFTFPLPPLPLFFGSPLIFTCLLSNY